MVNHQEVKTYNKVHYKLGENAMKEETVDKSC